ncbi:MAG: TolB family protein [Candidatus Kapaibacterium sp.]
MKHSMLLILLLALAACTDTGTRPAGDPEDWIYASTDPETVGDTVWREKVNLENYVLYRLDTKSGEVRRLTENAIIYSQPVGDRIFYTRHESGMNNIYSADLDGKNEELLMAASEEFPISIVRTFSEDKLAIMTEIDQNRNKYDLWIYEIGSGSKMKINPEPCQGMFYVSPDGEKLAFLSYSDASCRLHIYDNALGGSATRDFQRPAEGLLLNMISWSAAGDRLALVFQTEYNAARAYSAWA